MPAFRQHIIGDILNPPLSSVLALQFPQLIESFTQHLFSPLPSPEDTCLICVSSNGKARETERNTIDDLMFAGVQPDAHAGGCGR